MSTDSLSVPTRANSPKVEEAVVAQFSRMGFELVGWSTKYAGYVQWGISQPGHSGYLVETRVNISATDPDFPLEIVDAAFASGLRGELVSPIETTAQPAEESLEKKQYRRRKIRKARTNQSYALPKPAPKFSTQLSIEVILRPGSRLFVRGDGPGLNLDKGVECMGNGSGEWFWGTNDAVAPVQVRLYDNDEIEFAEEGMISINPAEQKAIYVTKYPKSFGIVLATAYIGIGNFLFIRGNAPGLTWDKGIRCSFHSIGKWIWLNPGTEPVEVAFYKNDEVPALCGNIIINPGGLTQLEKIDF